MPRIVVSSAPLFATPDSAQGRETDCLFGESVTIHGQKNVDGIAWCEITAELDSYRGWIDASALCDDTAMPQPTHRVIAPRGFITRTPDIKSATLLHLPLGSLLAATQDENGMMKIALDEKTHGAAHGYIPAPLIAPIDSRTHDWVAVAESLMGTPYLWGGRDSMGLDCSALVQLALSAGGIKSPRNTGEQEKTLGTTIASQSELRRGDLVFWRGHVGIMTDSKTLLHANMHHAMVATEPLAEATARLAQNLNLQITRLARV